MRRRRAPEPAPPPAARLSPEQALRRLELTVTRRLDGILHGAHQGLLPGPGSEPGETRVYVPGEDEVRRMDWYVTARTTVPHVRDQIADRELETWALVDLSASMDFGTTTMEKRDLAVAGLAAVGFLSGRVGDRLGAYVLHGGELHRWPARPGRVALHGLLHSIIDAPASPPAPPDAIDLPEALTRLARSHRKRGMRVIISDFLDPSSPEGAAWAPPLRRLAARHHVLAVEVLDPRELELPDVGLVTLTDPETGGTREVYLSRRVRAAYREAAAAQRAGTEAALRRIGVPHLVLRTDRDWVFDIARFVLAQRRSARALHFHPARGARR
ncbi:DUF58 domain-containing protein [Bailinhaonella thermotolerans]|uniref:DUF58 domain-containing protein n=1 Tax=Bailinhaonella thermotolerans TaxID=1070861 RepID=A0A3A4BUT7_9ACTN|nr:DUF58 domain-containing protein [Bailinhaonella thermotolerans]RJL35348.1 DUF58 domain-containing protein [Bailinhaonella thermotolerans]